MGSFSVNRQIGVARELGPMLEEVVFVGGQVAELLITSPGTTRVRPTTDVDVVVSATTNVEYRDVEKRLTGLGFRSDPVRGGPDLGLPAPDPDGRTEIRLTPLEPLERLARLDHRQPIPSVQFSDAGCNFFVRHEWDIYGRRRHFERRGARIRRGRTAPQSHRLRCYRTTT